MINSGYTHMNGLSNYYNYAHFLHYDNGGIDHWINGIALALCHLHMTAVVLHLL